MLIPTDPVEMFQNLLKATIELKPYGIYILKIESLYS